MLCGDKMNREVQKLLFNPLPDFNFDNLNNIKSFLETNGYSFRYNNDYIDDENKDYLFSFNEALEKLNSIKKENLTLDNFIDIAFKMYDIDDFADINIDYISNGVSKRLEINTDFLKDLLAGDLAISIYLYFNHCINGSNNYKYEKPYVLCVERLKFEGRVYKKDKNFNAVKVLDANIYKKLSNLKDSEVFDNISGSSYIAANDQNKYIYSIPQNSLLFYNMVKSINKPIKNDKAYLSQQRNYNFYKNCIDDFNKVYRNIESKRNILYKKTSLMDLYSMETLFNINLTLSIVKNVNYRKLNYKPYSLLNIIDIFDDISSMPYILSRFKLINIFMNMDNIVNLSSDFFDIVRRTKYYISLNLCWGYILSDLISYINVNIFKFLQCIIITLIISYFGYDLKLCDNYIKLEIEQVIGTSDNMVKSSYFDKALSYFLDNDVIPSKKASETSFFKKLSEKNYYLYKNLPVVQEYINHLESYKSLIDKLYEKINHSNLKNVNFNAHWTENIEITKPKNI